MIYLNRFYRSSTDKIINGTMGGLSKKLGIDSNIIRLAAVIFAVLSRRSFLMFVIYLMLPIFIQSEDEISSDLLYDNNEYEDRKIPAKNKNTLAVILIVLGVFLLLANNSHKFLAYCRRLYNYWPAILIVLGILIFVKRD
ncbi:MAG: PspC domain-containing protein [Tissierellia bacterium]|nr:PspC domain-containing protein [Tissierellia bacterium]